MQFLLHASSWLHSDVLYCSLVFRRCYICPPQLAYFMHHIDARGPKKEDVCDCRQSGTQDNIYLAHNLLFCFVDASVDTTQRAHTTSPSN
jgi:hypothetical protein